MPHFTKWLFSAACAAVVLGGCTGKQGDPGPTGATGATGSTGTSGQNLTGNLVGYVSPADENGTLLTKSGVVVSIDGSNPAITATSNADGRYELTNVRNGTYNLTYTRNGLATYRRYGVGHVGGDQPTYLGAIGLSQVSTANVTALSATSNPATGLATLTLTVTSPTPTSSFRVAFFASATSPVTTSTGTALTFVTFNASSASTSYSTTFTLSRATFNNLGFATGSTVYLAGFGSTAVTAGYSDPSTGRFIYPALNTASTPTVSVVVP